MASRSDANSIQITRVYDAPVQAVWDAWTDPAQAALWWGPRGFTITTHSKELRVGGQWRYTMHGPDGTDWPNITTYLVVEPLARLEYDHGATETTPPVFRVHVTFAETAGKTTMVMTMTLPTPEAAAATRQFVKEAGGNGTWDRLAEYLDEHTHGRRAFVINRSVEAPIERVYAMWTDPSLLARWLPPTGSTMRLLRSDLAEGQSTFFVLEGPHGTMYARAHYLTLEAPRRIVYTQQFVDAEERPAAAPGTDVWPASLRTTVELAEEGPETTRITVTTVVEGEASEAERLAFVAERGGMAMGWTGSLDALEGLLTP